MAGQGRLCQHSDRPRLLIQAVVCFCALSWFGGDLLERRCVAQELRSDDGQVDLRLRFTLPAGAARFFQVRVSVVTDDRRRARSNSNRKMARSRTAFIRCFGVPSICRVTSSFIASLSIASILFHLKQILSGEGTKWPPLPPN